MTSTIPRIAVLLPGTGSDEVFVRTVFAGPLAAFGVELIAPATPEDHVPAEGYLAALDAAAAAAGAPVLAGGISFGAQVALEWAVRRPDRCAGVLAALPGWLGDPGDAPGALAARVSADLTVAEGLAEALRRSTDGVPDWLAAELRRAWTRHGDRLADRLRAAAARPGPEPAALRGLEVPVGIAACTDDPVHPASVAHRMAAALPNAVVTETTLAALGADRESLGRAALLAYLRASSATPSR